MRAERKYTDAQMACIEEHRLDTTQHDTDWADHTTEQFIEGLEAFGITVRTRTQTGSRRNKEGKYESFQYSVPTVYWDVSYCQGEGAQFDAHRFSIAHFMETARKAITDSHEDAWWVSADEKPAWAKTLLEQLEWCESKYLAYMMNGHTWAVLQACDIVLTLDSSGHYSHSGGMSVEIDRESSDLLDDHPEHVRDAMGKLYTEVGGTEDVWRDFMRELADGLHKELKLELEYQQSDDAVWEHIEANDLFDPTTEDEGED